MQNVASQRAATSSGEPGVFERAPMAAGLVRITVTVIFVRSMVEFKFSPRMAQFVSGDTAIVRHNGTFSLFYLVCVCMCVV